MSKPSKFITNTDFSSLKNDDTSSVISITVPSAISVPGSGSYQNTVDIQIGEIASINRGMIASSKEGSEWYAGLVYDVVRVGSGSNPYDILAFFTRTSPTNIKAVVYINNPYNFTLTGASGAETFSFKLNTFVAPFI